MTESMEQAVALGAYAGTVLLPVAKDHADEGTYRVISGLVTELWAGLPLVHDQSYADEGLSERPHENTTTARASADTGEQPESPSDIVLDVLDMVRTFWQLARSGSAEELADVASFRLGEIAAGLDHVYAVRHGIPDAERPGTFESVVLDCLDVVEKQRSSTVIRAMGDRDLYDHAMTIGGHLAECLEQPSIGLDGVFGVQHASLEHPHNGFRVHWISPFLPFGRSCSEPKIKPEQCLVLVA